MSELKPCPFCKSQDTIETSNGQIHCHECNASASLEMWNQRPLEDKLVASALKLAANSGHMSFNTGHHDINDKA
ncbi:MAG: Lar family restriction alleviation protein [Pseudomonadota bacterium]|nr:Lar family restriction alleviation protein [Pseudomonadota bacterium]